MRAHPVVKAASSLATVAFGLLGAALAQGGGVITGFVTVPASVKDYSHLVVLACAKADPMCAKPAQVIQLGEKPGTVVKDGLRIPYSFVRLPEGEYSIYALNDKNDNLMHDPDSEEIGGYFNEGSFDPQLVMPPARGINFALLPLE